MNFLTEKKFSTLHALLIVTFLVGGGYFVQKAQAEGGSVPQVTASTASTAIVDTPTSHESDQIGVVGKLKIRDDESLDTDTDSINKVAPKIQNSVHVSGDDEDNGDSPTALHQGDEERDSD